MKRLLFPSLATLVLSVAVAARAADAPAPAPAQDDSNLKADNKQLSGELATAWKEADRLKGELAAAQAAAAKSSDQAADLQKQLDAIKPSSGGDLAAQLADVQDKLAVSLRSFSVVQDENTQLKATIDKLTVDNAALSQQLDSAKASIASLQAQAAQTSQIEPLRAEARHAEDEASRLAAENADLRLRMSLQAPSPGSRNPVPSRPSAGPSYTAPAPAAAPAPAVEARTYTVVEGDTLSKISKKFYGTTSRWMDILKANSDTLKDDKSLSVGATLKIP